MMKTIPVTEAIGKRLCQDLTQIIPGEKKGPRFRKGHLVTAADVPVLLAMGKAHLYVETERPGWLHEEEAARLLYALCDNQYFTPSEIKEGKIEALATADGLLQVDQERLVLVNSFGEMMIATKPSYFTLRKGEVAAGMRVIPLYIEAEKLQAVRQKVHSLSSEPLIQLAPFTPKKVAILTTGSEVFHGRIQDGFAPVLKEKLAAYPTEIILHTVLDDNKEMIVAAIHEAEVAGADIILCTGGMSVDADDLTPGAIKIAAKELITYGTPVLPGAMFALAYGKSGAAIMGLPGAVMFSKKTVFDLILPRVMADLPVTKTEIAQLGYGGLL